MIDIVGFISYDQARLTVIKRITSVTALFQVRTALFFGGAEILSSQAIGSIVLRKFPNSEDIKHLETCNYIITFLSINKYVKIKFTHSLCSFRAFCKWQ